MWIVDEKDPAIQAGKFAALLKAQKEESARIFPFHENIPSDADYDI